MQQQASDKASHGEVPKREFIWVPYSQISPVLSRAVVAAEDIGFFHHKGIDGRATFNALKENWQQQEIKRGGSTIHQQLAKNLFLSSRQSVMRKLHEALLALEMEQILGKRRVLEIYLNVIEWDEGVYGAEAAARHYFKVSAATLNRDQALFLAAIIRDPTAGHKPEKASPEVQARMQRIAALMNHRLLDNELLPP
jgi:monofunctional glycosyltransferase